MVEEAVIQKWEFLINAAKNYWVDSLPTGMSDETFDSYERKAAQEDGFFVRDYVFDTFLKGAKTKNEYIEKIKKFKVEGVTMLEAIKQSSQELGLSKDETYCTLKYDGSSIAIYLHSTTGKPKRIVTVGNLNLSGLGVDQTWKLMKFLPKKFPKGIVAIQAEALIDIDRLNDIDPDRARQKANGLINSKYGDAEVSSLLTLRAYRYYTDNTQQGQFIRNSNYKNVLGSFQTVTSALDGHVMFAPAQVWTLTELETMGDFVEHDRTLTNTGRFLNDGIVIYNAQGICQRALKYAGAGSGTEAIKTVVHSIQWNDQTPKGKDSWSANVIVDPVTLNGCTVKKPSAGSVAKLVKNNITPGAEVGIILANSTIPMVGEVFKGGNGDYQWPTCTCGYTMSEKDIYGSLIKCGNPMCSQRLNRMRDYVGSIKSIDDLDLNQLLVIDRFRWENTGLDKTVLLMYIRAKDSQGYHDYLDSFLKTSLQKRNLELVWAASFKVLTEVCTK